MKMVETLNIRWMLAYLLTCLYLCESGMSNKHQPELCGNITDNSSQNCPPWSYFDDVKQTCNHDIYSAMSIFDGDTYIRTGYCVTYNNGSGIVSFTPCPYFLSDRFRGIEKYHVWYIQLPDNISMLNDFMCGPLNRQGRVCGECKDGFGLAVMSSGSKLQCSNCTDTNTNVALYLFLEFVPLTLFYIFILIFRVNITSAPMTCYIMYSQLTALWWNYAFEGEDSNVSKQMFELNIYTKWFVKIILTIYDAWNLQFFRYLVPPFCTSGAFKLQPFHVGLLGYISILYPIFLIVITWICIELHDRNFKPLVWLWKPFHRCAVRLKGRLDMRRDIIDVFASFFLLSFSKVMYQTFFFACFNKITNKCYSNLGIGTDTTLVSDADKNVLFLSAHHLAYLIPAILVCFIFNVIPTLLLLLYPLKFFRNCLSKCRLDGLALNTFVEKYYGCYRDGLDGGKDMRSFAAFYFILRPMIFCTSKVMILLKISGNDPYLPWNAIFTIAALLIALCRPYKKTYMNILDTVLLIHFGLSCHIISSYPGFKVHSHFVFTFLTMTSVPLVGFLLFLFTTNFQRFRKARINKSCTPCCKPTVTEQLLIESANCNSDYGSVNK